MNFMLSNPKSLAEASAQAQYIEGGNDITVHSAKENIITLIEKQNIIIITQETLPHIKY